MNSVLATFISLAILFLIVGSWAASLGEHVISVRYDNMPDCQLDDVSSLAESSTSQSIEKLCTVQIPITTKLQAPIGVYYQVENFYSTHSRYLRSVSFQQMREPSALSATSDCTPAKKFGDTPKSDVFINSTLYDTVAPLTMYPCGLQAQSFFNDRFDMPCIISQGRCVQLLTDGSWNSSAVLTEADRQRFKARQATAAETQLNVRGFQMPSVDNVDFINWMHPSASSTQRRLYRVIGQDLEAGTTLQFTVRSAFSVSKWSGTKSLTIAEIGPLGTHQNFIGFMFIGVALVFLAAAALFAVRFKWYPPQTTAICEADTLSTVNFALSKLEQSETTRIASMKERMSTQKRLSANKPYAVALRSSLVSAVGRQM